MIISIAARNCATSDKVGIFSINFMPSVKLSDEVMEGFANTESIHVIQMLMQFNKATTN